MATVITNGKQTVKLYQSVNRGKAMYQLAYYAGGQRVRKNFADKAQAKRVANQVLGGLVNDADLVDAVATPEIESLVAAKKVLAPGYALHVAVEEHAQALASLGKATLREAVEFYLRHHRTDMPRLPIKEVAELFARSREQAGLSKQYIFLCRKYTRQLAEAFPGLCVSDLMTAALDKWISGLVKLAPGTKNDMRRVLVVFGGWAERQGYLVKDSSPFPGMLRYARTLRRIWEKGGTSYSLTVVQNIKQANREKGCSLLVLSSLTIADVPLIKEMHPKAILLLNPSFDPQILKDFPNDQLIIRAGEFSQAASRSGWRNFANYRQIDGMGEYFANWPEIISAIFAGT